MLSQAVLLTKYIQSKAKNWKSMTSKISCQCTFKETYEENVKISVSDFPEKYVLFQKDAKISLILFVNVLFKKHLYINANLFSAQNDACLFIWFCEGSPLKEQQMIPLVLLIFPDLWLICSLGPN